MIVTMSFYEGDAALNLKLLQWMTQLHGKLAGTCAIFFESSCDPTANIAQAHKCFEHVYAVPYESYGVTGHPAAPNLVFRTMALGLEKRFHGESWFFLDNDCVVLKSDWLDQIFREYHRVGKPFMGHVTPQGWMTGSCAVYPPQCWSCSIGVFVRNDDAVDCLLHQDEIEIHNANHLVHQVWNDVDGKPPTFTCRKDVERLIPPNIVAFHRCRDGSLIDVLRK